MCDVELPCVVGNMKVLSSQGSGVKIGKLQTSSQLNMLTG